MSLLPVIAWLLRDWRLVVWVCVPLLALTFAGYPFVPESPRFLLGKKRLEEATKILSKVAKVNGNPKPKDLESRLQVSLRCVQLCIGCYLMLLIISCVENIRHNGQ